ncbi:MAG: biotin/lipoyl-binding protein [Planctomycetota bacterium]
MPVSLPGLLATVGSLAMALALSGCKPAAPKAMASKAVDVIVASAVMKDVVNFEDFTGALEAHKKIDITARVTGYLEKHNFVEGGPVKKGQVLFEIDPRPTKAELDKAEAEVAQSQADVTATFETLGKAIADGFANDHRLQTDDRLDSLRSRPEFPKLPSEGSRSPRG